MDDLYRSTPTSPIEEPLPPYTPTHANERSGFLDEKEEDGFVARFARTWTRTATTVGPAIVSSAQSTSRFLQTRTWPVIVTSAQTTSGYVQHQTWPMIRGYPLWRQQAWGLLLFLTFGLGPFLIYGFLTASGGYGFYYRAFDPKTISCGDNLSGAPQNSTSYGIDALFVLNWSFGRFTFAQVKTIDVLFDVIIGRGTQMAFGAVAYIVFTDALLRLIERHPVSYQTFMRITIEGPSLSASCDLFTQLFRCRSKRTWFLFFYLLFSSFYIFSIPPLLGAMTGYDSRTIPWVSIGDADNIIPLSSVEPGYIAYGTWNTSFSQPLCDTAATDIANFQYHEFDMQSHCNCQLPNGTVLSSRDWSLSLARWDYYRGDSGYNYYDCHFNFTGNSGTYQSAHSSFGTMNCNDTFPVTLSNNITYSMYDLKTSSWGICWEGKAYDRTALEETARCLPDTANPSYQWGFSSMLMGINMIINMIWCLSMYVVWQEAMLNSELVRSGFRITPLRAAFVLTEVARRLTGLHGEELIQKEKGVLFKERKDKVVVDKKVLWEGGVAVQRRVKSQLPRLQPYDGT